MAGLFRRRQDGGEAGELGEDQHIPGTAIMRDHDGIRVQRAAGGRGEV